MNRNNGLSPMILGLKLTKMMKS